MEKLRLNGFKSSKNISILPTYKSTQVDSSFATSLNLQQKSTAFKFHGLQNCGYNELIFHFNTFKRNQLKNSSLRGLPAKARTALRARMFQSEILQNKLTGEQQEQVRGRVSQLLTMSHKCQNNQITLEQYIVLIKKIIVLARNSFYLYIKANFLLISFLYLATRKDEALLLIKDFSVYFVRKGMSEILMVLYRLLVTISKEQKNGQQVMVYLKKLLKLSWTHHNEEMMFFCYRELSIQFSYTDQITLSLFFKKLYDCELQAELLTEDLLTIINLQMKRDLFFLKEGIFSDEDDLELQLFMNNHEDFQRKFQTDLIDAVRIKSKLYLKILHTRHPRTKNTYLNHLVKGPIRTKLPNQDFSLKTLQDVQYLTRSKPIQKVESERRQYQKLLSHESCNKNLLLYFNKECGGKVMILVNPGRSWKTVRFMLSSILQELQL